MEIYEDPSAKITSKDILKHSVSFKPSQQSVPKFNASLSSIWIRFILKNGTGKAYCLEINNQTVDELELYELEDDSLILVDQVGDYYSFDRRPIRRNNFILNLDLQKDEVKTFYLKYKGTEGMEMPVQVKTLVSVIESSYLIDLFFGIFYGIVLVTVFYNLFLFLTIKDKSYL